VTPSPRRSGRPSAISSVGLTGAPSTASAVAPLPEARTEAPVTPRPRDVVTSRRPRTSSAPSATAETTVSYTIRFDQDESSNIDELMIRLKRAAGRRTLDRSEVIRTLLRLADENAAVRAALVDELTPS
jgi:hypothetical protein